MRWEVLDEAPVPAGGTMSLCRRGSELLIRVQGNDLMSSRAHGSEDALAELAAARIGPASRVLVGGLGMGFTLAATLRCLGPDASIVVAELVPAVIRWNEGVVGEVAGRPLQDPRVTVVADDVAEVIRAGGWDAILLDVDNGPDGLTRPGNDALYGAAGLARAREGLRPGGVLGVWSAAPSPAFAHRLARASFAVDEVTVRAHGRRGRRHTIWLATRRDP